MNDSLTLARAPLAVRAVALAAALYGAVQAPAHADAFSAGNLIVSRTVYSGTSALVAIGQALPGGGVATADGSFPNVFKNEVPDASFGVSSAIYLDQVSTSGSVVNTLAVDTSQMTSSFASKSELALNVSTDGSTVTFMGYKAAVNTLDVSNSNTAAVFDSTNPVSSTYARAIGAVNLSTGALTVTSVNAYSGNNGRAAVLANGNYYMVGNAGNGSATGAGLSQLSDNTGVQMIAAGSSGNTTVVGKVNGAFTNTTDKGYQRGFSVTSLGYAADKSGKDDNFRGMTVFNNTLYVTKGSGSNGVNTVYKVGTSGQLPSVADSALADIAPLAGFPTGLAKSAGAAHPFGIWFGDATTLFVGDEGDGVRIGAKDASGNPVTKDYSQAGLQEWKLGSNGVWTKAATFQAGLNLGQVAYAEGGGADWNVYTDGLRNITGVKNDDGSYDIYGTTSTVSDELTHDLGADRNEVVHFHVTGTTAAAANVVQTAAAAERLGGVAITPVPEPESNALLIAGLGLLGALARRRVARG